jgi:hypothetical protein
LCLDSFDHPHIAYCKWPPLYYAHWDGSIWHNEGPIDAASWEIRLDLDSLGLPHIVYIDQMGQRPEYCYRDSIAWHLCGYIEPDPYVLSYRSVSLCLDDNSKPHVAYIGSISNYNKMKYAKGTFVSIEEQNSAQNPKIPKLEVYPSPFREKTVIRCSMLARPASQGEAGDTGYNNVANSEPEGLPYISLKIYDVTGSLVRDFSQLLSDIGYRSSVIWDAKDDHNRKLSSGVYFIRLESGDHKVTKKAILLK